LVKKGCELSITQQCQLLGLNRSGVYYEPAGESAENLEIMRLIDEQYTETPFYGSRRMAAVLSRHLGRSINRKRTQRLMRLMGIEALYPRSHTSKRNQEHEKFPYLLNGVTIQAPNHVWSTDITYVRMTRGYLYLVAIIDWYSRYVISWELSNTLDNSFCISALNKALKYSKPDIFNSDQGSQFTSKDFTKILKENNIRISMDGKGRVFDNIFVERLWRSLKYEEVYLKNYESVPEAVDSIQSYWLFYNHKRLHQALGYHTPAEVHFGDERTLN